MWNEHNVPRYKGSNSQRENTAHARAEVVVRATANTRLRLDAGRGSVAFTTQLQGVDLTHLVLPHLVQVLCMCDVKLFCNVLFIVLRCVVFSCLHILHNVLRFIYFPTLLYTVLQTVTIMVRIKLSIAMQYIKIQVFRYSYKVLINQIATAAQLHNPSRHFYYTRSGKAS